MQVSVESGEGLEKRLLIDIPAERVSAEMDKKLKDLARHVRLDGFRPGKVPMRVVKQRFGDQVRQEVYGDLVQATLYEAASEQKIMPAGEPSVELRDPAEEGGFGYTATFEVMPEIAVGDMSAAEIKRPQVEIQDADVDAMIEKLRKQRTTWDEVDRAGQDGDTLHIDFVGTIDGEVFEGGSAEDVPLVLGSDSMIEGFEAGLLGAAVGDERTLDVTFPENYQAAHLAGKAASFEVKVNKVSEPALPELDEEFIKVFGVEDGTVEGLRVEVTKNMQNELDQKLKGITKERVMDALIAVNPLDVPKAMVAQESERMKQQALQDMQSRGQQSSMDLPASIFEGQAQRRVHLGLLVNKVIESQELSASDEQLRSTIEAFAESYENPQEVVDYYLKDEKQRAGIENLVLEDQVVEWVLGQADVQAETPTFDEIMNPVEGGK